MTKQKDGCVVFNKNSWHYKVVDYVFPYVLEDSWRRLNLCPYLRMVLAATLSFPFMIVWNQFPWKVRKQAGIFQLEFIYLAIVIGVAFLLDFADSYEETNALPPFLDMVAIGFFLGNAFGVIGGLVLLGVIRLIDYLKHKPKKQNSSVGLFKAYVHAKHNKICPCVEFVDEEEDEKLK